jgi:uncharacterized membrane protein YhaH (DUF805 family)
MDFQAIFENFRHTVTEHYFDTRGRVGRSQFWYFVLAYVVGALVASIVGAVIFVPVGHLYNLAMLFPLAGMGARRLQDIGRDGKLIWVMLMLGFVSQVLDILAGASAFALGPWSLIFLAPQLALLHLALLVASVVFIYFWCQPGDSGDNAYGPPPPVFDPSVKPAV